MNRLCELRVCNYCPLLEHTKVRAVLYFNRYRCGLLGGWHSRIFFENQAIPSDCFLKVGVVPMFDESDANLC